MDKNQSRDELLHAILRETVPKPRTAEETQVKKSRNLSRETAPEAAPVRTAVTHEIQAETDAANEERSYDAPSDGLDASSWGIPETPTDEVPESGGDSWTSRTPETSYDADLISESQPAMAAEGVRPVPARTGRRQCKKKHRVIRALVMTFVILVVSIVLSAILIVYGRDLLGINSNSSTKIVTIPNDVTMEEIAEILHDEDIISQPDFFVVIAGLSKKDTDVMPGDHVLRPDMAYETILSELVSEPLDGAVSVSVTFPEGIRLVDAADLLEENNVCDADEFLTYFNQDALFGYTYEDYLPSFQDEKFYVMEGYLFPDTYTFYQEMSVELVCQKILYNFDSKITTEYYDRMEALRLSLDEMITLASMIQAEAGSTEQMADIASVFWNRLNNSTEYPLLQSDPTTNYVEEVIKPHSETYNQTFYDSYDTYTCSGLPAGPICNPGSDAIYAALYPSNTNYYYFYSNIDTGETYFARTLDEHDANQAMVASMQAAEAEVESEAEEEAEDDSTADE